MSAFEVSLTPTRVKKPQRNENREPVPVILAPFSAKSIVVFEDVPVSKTARRVLVVTNPSDAELEVSLARKFRAELNISVEWEATRIPAQGSVTMELVWNPLKIITSSESIQFIDNRNFRKDVSVVLKSIVKFAGTKNPVRYPNISCAPAKPAPKMFKSATSHAITAPAVKPQPLGSISKSEMNIAKVSSRNDVKRAVNDRQEKFEMHKAVESPKTPRIDTEKENVSPETPKNASDLFDMFKFTPCTETKTKHTSNLEILSSMPTPVLRKKSELLFEREEATNPRRLGEGATEQVERPQRQTPPRKSPRWVPKIVKHCCTPPSAEKAVGSHPPNRFDPHIVSTASKRAVQEKGVPDLSPNLTDQMKKLFPNNRTVPINKTFELNNESIGSTDSTEGLCEEAAIVEPVMNRTTTIASNQPRLLSIIDEEERPDGGKLETDDKSFSLQKTYAVPDEKLLRDVQLIGTPLRKACESLQDLSSRKLKMPTQGSLPNLTEMGSLHSIEHNRYYLAAKIETDDSSDALDMSSASTKSTTVSAHELMFDQQEILAQSSRFNLNEVGRRIKKEKSPNPSVKSPASSISPAQMASFKRQREHSVDSPTNVDFLAVPTYAPGTCFMAVSPPKKSRMDPNERPGTRVRVKKWSATQPKKSVRSNMAALRKPLTPRKIKIEPGVRLYDTDMYLQSYINPDPFAATITFDPFLASTMYLDDQTTRRHEQQLMKWLNALVALPADLDADCNRKVDVGNLFNLVRNQELILAPTKEEQSMNYLTKSRMEALRKAAVTLYMSHEMVEVCSKVAVHINKNAIELRKDRDLHLDVVMQRYILELLLSFNPLWLRLGLEVVFGEIIHLHSNSDIVGLSTFILNRLFRDRFIEEKHSKAYHLSQQYSAHMKKFTLLKFLLLIFFLDKAKSKKIIKHNPCLFLANSKYKETKEILLRFSSELISNVGDITRNLRRLGYFLAHKQTFIDEFNYAFKNLAVDLRDGVRLTRVMEIILLRDDLTSQLRAPAISRTQKAFNVNLALKALADANFTLTGGICAYDIVDGHREKTLSLLWQIIYKFRSPKFHAAAATIQRWWRNSWLGVVIKRRIRVKIEMRRNEAARTIQAAYRGYASRKFTACWKRERVTAVTSLQRFVRGFLCRRKLRITMNSICLVQRWFRATHLAKIERTRYVYLKTATIRIQQWYRRITMAKKLQSAAFAIKDIKKQAKIEYDNAILIQRAWKSFTIRKRLQILVHQVVYKIRSQKIEYRSAARIQSFFQMIKLRKHYSITKQSSITIQRAWRRYKLTQSIRLQFIQHKTAAITIQKYFKGYRAMKQQRYDFQTMRQSAIKIQRRYRETICARKQRIEFLKLRTSAIAIQRHFRANMMMRSQRENYRKLKNAAILIQQRFRAQLLMKQCRKLYLHQRNAAVKIQLKLRATLLARRVRLEFLSMQFHAILIQQRFRANQLMKRERRDYELLRAASVTMQQRYRAQLIMRVDRKRFLVLKIAAIVFQTRFRAQMAMKVQRKEYLRLKSSVVVVQQRFRAMLAMRKQRSEYCRIREAVVKIQRYYRAILLMRSQRASFVALKSAAISLQAQYRAQQAMKKCRLEYNQLKMATINVQQRFRALQLMRKERASYNHLKKAAINIQTRYRALKLMKRQRSSFESLKLATIIIQRRFRANQEMKSKRAQFLTIKDAAVIVQTRYRAQKAMLEASRKFAMIRSKTILIQRFIRSSRLTKCIRQEFIKTRTACLTIQSWWRRTLLMRKERAVYLQKLRAVAIIQTRWRAHLEMYNVRIEYLHTIRCILRIQRYYKSYRLTKQLRADFLKRKQAAITIQQRYRGQKIMIKNRNEFLVKKIAAIKIQQWFRSAYLMKIERKKFIKLRQATILIQQTYRAQKLARNQHAKYLQIRDVTIQLQSHARGLLARRHFNEMLTPERREEIRRRKAVRIIQKNWRGYAIRKRWHSVEFQLMRNRLKLARANFKPANAIRNLVVASVQRLKERYPVTELLSILIRLENLSRVVPHTLKEQAAFIASFSYGIMAQANRSEPDKQVIELCSRIILNFARYPGTKEDVFQEPGLVTIAQMLLRWSDKDCPIFNTLCTLVWVFIHCEDKRKVIYNFMTTRESMFMVRETKKLVIRKEKMRSRSRKPNNLQNPAINLSKTARQTLPNLESDFGVVRLAPYIFNCSIFALDTILSILDITL